MHGVLIHSFARHVSCLIEKGWHNEEGPYQCESVKSQFTQSHPYDRKVVLMAQTLVTQNVKRATFSSAPFRYLGLI